MDVADGQAKFDFGGEIAIQRPVPSAVEERLRKLNTPASFDDEAPPSRNQSHQATLVDRMLAEELLQPDPILTRTPQVGDVLEVLWTHCPSQPWASGTVLHDSDCIFLTVQMDFRSSAIWTVYRTRKDRARNPNIDKGPLWRWPWDTRR